MMVRYLVLYQKFISSTDLYNKNKVKRPSFSIRTLDKPLTSAKNIFSFFDPFSSSLQTVGRTLSHCDLFIEPVRDEHPLTTPEPRC